MEEKVLITSEQYVVKKFLKAMVIVGVILSLLMNIWAFVDNLNYYDNKYNDYEETHYLHNEYGCDYDWRYVDEGEKCWECEDYERGKFGYAVESTFYMTHVLICFIPFASLSLIGGLIYIWLRSYELTVTNKRIYGKIAFGKRVDLPVDSISATATIRMLKGISVSTSSGKISFRVIKNADEIYEVINNLLIERQQEKVNPTVVTATTKSDETDQLKKYKDLLDNGIITQEEFDQKKKQLLGL